VQPAASGQPATSGQPAASGQTTTSGQPTAAGQPATPGQPAASGQPATSGQTTVSGQIPSAAAGTPAAPQATPQPAGNAQPALSPAASSSPPARLPSTGTPPTQPANSANRLPAAPDTADTAKQARNCYVPDDLLSEPGRLPGLSAALVRGKGDLLVIMLGSESTNPSPARPASIPNNTASSDAGGGISSRLRATLAAAARNPLAERLQERLIQDLGPLPGRTIHVESVGRRNSTVAEQASLINKQVLPRKPALVIWNLGRTDTRRGLPPANMARALDRGLEQLRRQHIDTIVMDPPYHPQFEAFYRTDDYRQYIRWTMNLHDQPYLQRYDMIDYWASTGRIDLDSGEPDRQAAAVTFTETCIAYQLSRMIDRGLSRK
jgi:cell surface protein, putative